MNSITYSRSSKPDYPYFVVDATKTINLCYFHDVKNCMTPDYT